MSLDILMILSYLIMILNTFETFMNIVPKTYGIRFGIEGKQSVFLTSHIPYLGYLVSEPGIEPLPEKKRGNVKEMLPPRHPKAMKQLPG